jgi:hypothetical protein
MTQGLSILGAVTGVLGLLVSLLVYLRDAPRVRVNLRFDMKGWGSLPDVLHCVVAVYNVGRRTIYLERINIPPTTAGGQTLIWDDTMGSVTLPEGGKPHVSFFRQEGFENEHHVKEWWRIRAMIWDAAGRSYRSYWLTERPSFATTDPPPFAIPLGRLLNRLTDLRLHLLA